MKLPAKFPSIVLPVAWSSVGLHLVYTGSFAALALWLGVRLSGLLAPSSLYLPSWSQPDVTRVAQQVVARHWFGVALPPSAPLLRVLGVFALQKPEAAGAFVILEQGGQLLHRSPGQLLGNGWRLTGISAQGVELRHGELHQFYPLTSALTTDPAASAPGEPPVDAAEDE